VIRPTVTLLLVSFAAVLSALAETSTRVSSQAPIINFSLPTFTNPDGYRDWLIRGSEAWMTDQNIIDVKDLSLTVFRGDSSNQIDTMMISPAARVRPEEKIITGDSTLRGHNLNDGFEATGEDWKFTYTKKTKTKTVTLAKNVRVVLRAEFKNLLK